MPPPAHPGSGANAAMARPHPVCRFRACQCKAETRARRERTRMCVSKRPQATTQQWRAINRQTETDGPRRGHRAVCITRGGNAPSQAFPSSCTGERSRSTLAVDLVEADDPACDRAGQSQRPGGALQMHRCHPGGGARRGIGSRTPSWSGAAFRLPGSALQAVRRRPRRGLQPDEGRSPRRRPLLRELPIAALEQRRAHRRRGDEGEGHQQSRRPAQQQPERHADRQ